jgi:lincosamide nucleotidyltransferase A/C/D/E
MMDARGVLSVIATLEQAGVRVWLDGGWGVDALVGEQTRDHDDLDCVIALCDAPIARDTLAVCGFAVAIDEVPTRFVVRDPTDRRVDFHTVTFDAHLATTCLTHVCSRSWQGRCPIGLGILRPPR